MNLVNKSTANKGGIYFDEMRCRKISFILYINIKNSQNYDIIQLAVGMPKVRRFNLPPDWR